MECQRRSFFNLCHIPVPVFGEQKATGTSQELPVVKDKHGVTELMITATGLLVLYQLFDTRKQKLLVLDPRDPERSRDLAIVAPLGSQIDMPNGLTAVQSCGNSVIVDGGHSLLVVDVVTQKCLATVESASHEFFCCTDDKLVVLGQV
jgi:hypothetical protein